MPRRKYDWESLSNEDLLKRRLGSLRVGVEGTWLEDCVEEGKGWAYVWARPKRFRVAVPCRGHYSIPFYVPRSLLKGTPAEKVKPGESRPTSS